ncbi:hypothetical protein LOTGIDRAFT_129680 [Lottia gigantea]|uniref:Arsenite methyltransferase n=1 Tax=Lottia gigantea TaxID=225164 RepID=V3ZYW1_LOTGI|nr:hypothetical protein LOTGIDRAFT_129680 [Lottia gigantea]ESO86181.1 hypothetical protein LOTGIDRAFT_129680 [Lottia gigantea]
MCEEQNLFNSVKNFYDDVSEKLDFVCEINNPRLSQTVRDLIRQLHPDILKRNYGSAFIVPDKIEGCKILDFGCGAGVMVYVLSKLVGQKGSLVGIDISPNLITEANKVISYHQKRWGYSKPNTTFKVANVETFDEVKEYESTMDLVLSYGVICLCPNKEKVFTNIYRLLKDGGEFSLSDIYADRDRPEDIINNQPLGTACSMKWDEMIELATSVGFTKPYLVGAAPVEFQNKDLHKKTGFAEFVRAEWRMFKLPKNIKHRPAEVMYNGNIKGSEESYRWDLNTLFKKGEPVLVDAELATILAYTRFKDSFSFRYLNEGLQVCLGVLFER